MAWAETFPVPGSRLISLFRTDFNNIIDSLVTVFLGPVEPDPMYAGMLWADTNQGLLKQRNVTNTGWTIRAELEVDYGGALTRAGTAGTPMTGLIDMGGFPITNVGAGSGTSVARVTDLASYLKADGTTQLTGLLRQGGAAAGLNPSNVDDLARKGYVDSTRLAGGTYTGQITMPFAPAAGSQQLVRQIDLETVRDGHVHNGAAGQGQKINIGNLSGQGQGAWRFPRANGSNGLVLSQVVNRPMVFLNDCPTVFGPGSATGWQTVSLAAWIAESGTLGPYAALLNVELVRDSLASNTIRFEVRKTGTTPGGPQRLDLTTDIPDGGGGQRSSAITSLVWAELDPTTRNFDWRLTGAGASGTAWIRLVAWLRQTAID